MNDASIWGLNSRAEHSCLGVGLPRGFPRGKGCARAVKCETNGLAAGFVLKGTLKALGRIG